MINYNHNVLGDNIGFVELASVNPPYGLVYDGFTTADAAIVQAARVSFGKEGLKGEKADKNLLSYLYKNEHMSPFEMVQYTFRIKAPIMVFNHFVRHRMASLNVQSYRYTEAQEDEFYIPDTWRLQSPSNKQGSDGEASAWLNQQASDYLDQIKNTSVAMYKYLVHEGIAKEQARLVLPAYSLYTSWIWSIDLRNLLHFLELRTASNAQWETRQYAQTIAGMVAANNPACFNLINSNQ